AASTVAQAAPATLSPDVQQLSTISVNLAAVRQSVDQLAARQQQVAEAITRLHEADQDILNKISVPAPQPTAAPARKPTPATPPRRGPRPGRAGPRRRRRRHPRRQHQRADERRAMPS